MPDSYKSYTSHLKASLLEARQDSLRQLPPEGAFLLLEEARQKFGDALVCGLTPDSLAWLLKRNARTADTLAPPSQLDTLQCCIETVVEEGIPGDVIEAGCFRGGQCALMAGVLRALGALDRNVFAADSFAGLPEPDTQESPDDAVMHFFLASIGRFSASLEQFEDTLRRYDLLDSRIHAIVGWFRESLPKAPIDSLSVIRLDATFHQSTRNALENLYPKLAKGGFVICADYCVPTGARRAVDEYRLEHAIAEPLIDIDAQGVMWRRES